MAARIDGGLRRLDVCPVKTPPVTVTFFRFTFDHFKSLVYSNFVVRLVCDYKGAGQLIHYSLEFVVGILVTEGLEQVRDFFPFCLIFFAFHIATVFFDL